MWIPSFKQGLYLLLIFLIIKTQAIDEFDIVSEFDDGPEKSMYLAEQIEAVADWSLPSSNRDVLAEELEKLANINQDNHSKKKFPNPRLPRNDVSLWPSFRKYYEEEDMEGMHVILHLLEPDFSSSNNPQKKASIYKWYVDFLRSKFPGREKLDSIKAAKYCSNFPMDPNGPSKVTCSSVFTLLGVVNWCKISCIAGHRLKRPFPHYELCGKPTKYRWTFELRGLEKPSAKCIVGISASKKEPCTTPQCFETAAYYMNKIDYSVDPCDSFSKYACGRWVEETQIPEYRSSYNTYGVIRDRVNSQVADLLNKPASSNDSDAVIKAKTFYESCMNTQLLEELDAAPLLNLLQNELTWPIIEEEWTEDDFDFEATVATLRGKFNNKVMMDFVVQKHDGEYALESLKGKLPHRISYYTNKHLRSKLLGYSKLIKDIAEMLGAKPSVAFVDVVDMMRFEEKLTKMKSDDFELEEYQVLTVEEMNQRIPEVNFLTLLRNMLQYKPVYRSTTIVVWDENYLKDLMQLVKNTPKRVVQNFMVWQVVRHRIQNLNSRFMERLLELQKLVEGTKALPPRKFKCSQDLMLSMQGPTSKLFIDEYFTDAKKKAAEELFEYIRKGFIELLETESDWMDDKTKEYAKRKALNMKTNVGYNPDIYENITFLNEQTKKLKVFPNDYFGNYVRLLEDITQRKFDKLGLHEDSSEFLYDTRATMVNAFYAVRENAMILPCGEMQYPFYWGDKYPRMFQFGAIGTILGHELTHGFDENGRKFGIDGELNNWWSPASLKEFNQRIKCLENQYSDFYWDLASDYLDGANTLSENIADNGGIRESYAGYHLWLKSKNMTSEKVEPATGFTNDQMFFIGFANARCAKYTPKGAEFSIVENVHSPGRFRIDGSLQNFAKFSEAFNCPQGSFMNPKDKCVVW